MGEDPGPERPAAAVGIAGRLARAAEVGWLGGVALALFTGFYILPATIHAPGYFTVLQVHIAVGLTALALVLPGIVGHFARHPDRRARGVLVGGAVLLGSAGLFLEALPTPEEIGEGEVGAVLSSMAVSGLLLLAVGWRTLGRGRHGAHWTGAILVFLVCGSLTSGWASWQARGDSRVLAEQSHSLLGVAVFFALIPHMKLVRGWLRGDQRRGLLVAAVVGAVALGVFRLELTAKVLAPTDLATIRETTPLFAVPMNAAERSSGYPWAFDEDHIDASRSCGAAGCHPALTEQWAGSAHRFAADNRLYRMSIAELVKERGVDEAVFCANCHDPERVLAGTVQRDYAGGDPPPSDGVSCIACHSSVPPDGPRLNGNQWYRQPVRYPGAHEAQQRRNIRLDPRAHRAGFNIIGHTQGQSGCVSCHRVELGPDMGAAVSTHVQVADVDQDAPVDCNHCHMPNMTPSPRGRWDLGFESPAQYNHHIVGMNMDLPLYATHVGEDGALVEAVAREAREFVAGRLHPFEEGDDELAATEYGSALIEALDGAVLVVQVAPEGTGDGVDVRVTSANVRGGHSFPIGPFDLQEVWLEVVARDADGREWARIGGLDERGYVDPGAPRLGGVERDRAGQELLRHRIWDVAHVEGVRQVGAGRSVSDRVFLPIPPEAPRDLEISARWNLRRLSPRVGDEAFGEGQLRFPVHDIGDGVAQVRLPEPAPAGPEPE